MDVYRISLYLLLLLYLLLSGQEAANILLLSFAWKSHFFEMSAIGKVLYENGHEISAVLPPSYPDLVRAKQLPFDIIEYQISERDVHGMDQDEVDNLLENLMTITPIQDFRQNIDGFVQLCSNPLSDDKLFKKLKSKHFDLAIVDAFPGSRCYYVLMYRLGIPYISLTTTYEPWLFRNPALPSFVPFPYAQYFTERMTLRERLVNLYTLVDWSISPGMSYVSDEFVSKYLPDKPFKSLNELARASKFWLFDTDVILDYPRPTMPNEINVGGLSTKPAEPLPENLKIFADTAKHGLVIVSFGSFDVLTKDTVLVFLGAFRHILQHVVLRTSINLESLNVEIPGNVRIMSWIPQNDLLGHPNTKLFITHCGANGQFEALYHAVPLLGFPIFADQPYNARRAKYHGFGEHMDLINFDSPMLIDMIQNIISNKSYYNNIRKASEIFQSQLMTPQQRAAYWVEEVLADRVDHLHSYALDMPWYEYLMIDILAIGVVAIIITVVTLWTVMNALVDKCKAREHKAKLKVN